MSEFVDVEWFGREDKIGIVLTYDRFDGFKARMAPVPEWSLHTSDDTAESDEARDVRWLMQNAAKIPFEWAWGIWGKRMLATWQDKHLNLDSWPTVRYDRVDYDVKTLEEVKDD